MTEPEAFNASGSFVAQTVRRETPSRTALPSRPVPRRFGRTVLRVAVILTVNHLAGCQSAEIDHLARHAGLAQGIVQVIAALPLDAIRRQLFVPLQLLEGHGCGMEEVFSGKLTPQARAATDQLLGEARGHLEAALALLESVPPEARRVFLPLAVVRRDLPRMARADSDPFTPQPNSRFRTLWTLWRASKSPEFGG